ncbi:SDR family NAD(P)-dependent oxidoreductase [Streptomyces griseiscabiei]|uniref:SDR family NAD(P)-dependent oxidoreductase n=1 Tax=Streptomyces griseiscabiei TaxID=2993540 RepID=A0ABU4LH11_9ACTN|nr:SDR family NAD(P)-dependent oxidoreductase [Streptomyces griseiscabiei]MBZ3900412.1 SDR family NAD(P)-dependent oxidoreductase [Streptomyces griseiscabiei]MDX2914580.1 SDR family NAD(P)-dependent oxidoreductase [Streptomyces griseiscabiei]
MTRTLALITGASSGIGAAYARLLAADSDFVLVARRVDRLSELAAELRASGADVEVLPADLGTSDGLAAVTKRLSAGDVRLLISNAGVGGYAPLADVDPDEIDRLLTLNGVAPIQLVRAALPGMLAADEGKVVTVASLLAFSAGQTNPHIPSRTLYAAAKAATVAFTRTLAHELADTGVHAQVVCPGVVATEFSDGYGKNLPFAMTAEGVAQASLAGLRLGETICVPGLEDQADALDALLAAESGLLAGGNRPTPAERYGRG